MRATSEVLEENKVKIAVEVDEDEVEAAVATAAKALARQVKIPGFRPGKAPRQVVEARIGGPRALRDEAMRELLPDYYARAISATEVEPISAPELNVTRGEEEGPVEFDAVVEVRPQIRVTGYDGLRVTIPSPLATDDELDQLLDQLRETDAVLTEVARPIVTGDYVTVDVKGRDAEGTEVVSVDDYVYVVGQGSFVDTADDQLPGMRAGESLEVAGTAPGGAQMSYSLVLKDVRERVLPELTDEWVEENSEFATAQELRDSSLERISTYKRGQARRVMRDATIAELASQVADVDVPDTLLDAETRERFSDFQQNLESQGATIDQFFERHAPDPGRPRRDAARGGTRSPPRSTSRCVPSRWTSSSSPRPRRWTRRSPGSRRRPATPPRRSATSSTKNGRLGSLRAAVTKQLAADWVLERVIYVDETGSLVDRSLLEADEDGDDTTEGTGDDTAEPTEQVDQSANEHEEHT